MMLLVKISLKFQMLISEIHHYFLLKKNVRILLIFSTKNSCVFGYEVVKNLTSSYMPLLIKFCETSTKLAFKLPEGIL